MKLADINTRGLAVGGSIGKSITGLLYPPECVLCKLPLRSGAPMCTSCYAACVSDYYRCGRCAMALPSVVPNDDCLRCRGKRWAFKSVITLGPYQSSLREIVIAMKKPKAESLRRAVGRLLAEQVQMSLDGTYSHLRWQEMKTARRPILLPVPYHWTHSLKRAADTAGSLAAAIGQTTGLTVKKRIIRRTRRTNKQGMLAWSERVGNVRGAFAIRNASEVKGRHVFLVDDVLTSGATSAELARVIRRAGAERIDVVVAARGTGVKSVSPQSADPPD